MEALFVIGGIWFVFWVIGKFSDSSSSSSPIQSRNRTAPTRRPTPSDPKVYRPKARSRSRSSIKFSDSGTPSTKRAMPTAAQLKDLHDAFTGAPLDPALGLYRCSSCKVYYHRESFDVLSAENSRQCVACSSTDIVSLSTSKARKEGGRDHDPDVITLQNFREHVGRVITFEGRVHKVLTSRRGNDYAVMFENKNWTKGLKLVFFRGTIRKVGGAKYIKGLTGKNVKARGLLINHETFGHEIIISEKSMILNAKQ